MVRAVLACFCAVALAAVWAQGFVQDQTRVPGAHGSDVVGAVVSLIEASCVFPGYKRFLRQLAYVSTHDGDDPRTYRPGFDGGIWQIDEQMLNSIRNSSRALMLFDKVNTKFAVDFRGIQWSELRKPMISGLAAALYVYSLDVDIEHLLEGLGPSYATSFKHQVNNLESVCKRSNLDLVFVVDTSPTISAEYLNYTKQLMLRVVNDTDVNDHDHVALVTFNSFQLVFGLNKNLNKADVMKAIDSMHGVVPWPGNDLDQALTYISNFMFTKSNDAGSKKKIVMITPEQIISSRASSILARLKNQDTEIFVVSVSSGDVAGLLNVVSGPQCTHYIRVPKYLNISTVHVPVNQLTCTGPKLLRKGTTTHACSQSGNYEVFVSGTVTQISVHVSNGDVDIKGSLSGPNSSFTSRCDPVHPCVIVIKQGQEDLHLSVSGHGSNTSCKGNYTLTIGDVDLVPSSALVTCLENKTLRACTPDEKSGKTYSLIPLHPQLPTVCKPGETAYHAYPQDPTKFLLCKLDGSVFLFQCSKDFYFSSDKSSCVAEQPSTQAPAAASPLRRYG